MTDNLPAPLPPALTTAQQAHVINILRRASRAEVMPRFRNLAASDIAAKSGPNDLVTAADLAAEAMITRALRQLFPSALIVGEEAVASDPSLPDKIADAPLAFLIDPVDGTWNFAHGLSMFGMILCVTRFGKPAFGVIYDPTNDDWVIADSESPARLEGPLKAPRDLRVSMGKPIETMSGYIPLGVFPMDQRIKLAATLPGFGRVNSLRCSAHEYRMVAQGNTDFVLSGSLHPWDHAAGALICAQAGGHVEMLSGGPYDATLKNGYLLAAPDKTTWNRLRKVFSFLVE
ncbi:inositol monophosphatase family protein [Sulfitobacter sp.]|uniref:inositol monophosphatase family protein n=1 Tax=Sulfitobacter sp. TaxID=1903071 RepID=UPI003566556C